MAGRALDELARNVSFILMIDDVQRAGRTIMQARCVEHLVPDLTTARGSLMNDAGALADRPDMPKLRTDAPCARGVRSKTTTERPRFAAK